MIPFNKTLTSKATFIQYKPTKNSSHPKAFTRPWGGFIVQYFAIPMPALRHAHAIANSTLLLLAAAATARAEELSTTKIPSFSGFAEIYVYASSFAYVYV